jgi:hypothetical protein
MMLIPAVRYFLALVALALASASMTFALMAGRDTLALFSLTASLSLMFELLVPPDQNGAGRAQ